MLDLAPETEMTNVAEAAPRIKLRDGRYVAYRERGVPKDQSKYKIIIVHGFGSSKDMSFHVSQEVIQELEIYIVLYDRAGYGESDPNPKHSVKSEALDVEEIADHLELGSVFYVIGVSIGSYPVWSCLKHIPQRLAGAALIVPAVNYRWPSLPENLMKKDYRRDFVKWSYRISKYFPALVQWWVTNKLFASTSAVEDKTVYFSTRDIEILGKTKGFPMLTKERLRQQGVFNTLRGDFMTCFGDWDFDPLSLTNPLPEKESSFHIWQGYEDKVIPVQLQRYISRKLPWIRYHEIPDGGHLIVHYDGMADAILKSLLLGEEPQDYKPTTEPLQNSNH